MELGTAEILAQIKRATGSLEPEGKDTVPVLPPVLLWRVEEVVDENWLGDRRTVTGEILPFSNKAFLAQHMRFDTQKQERASTAYLDC